MKFIMKKLSAIVLIILGICLFFGGILDAKNCSVFETIIALMLGGVCFYSGRRLLQYNT